MVIQVKFILIEIHPSRNQLRWMENTLTNLREQREHLFIWYIIQSSV